MSARSSRPEVCHFGLALVVLASLGIAEAAPPAGKPVFIHIEGLAPTSVGQNGFIVGGDDIEFGAFQWMPTSGVTNVGGGLGTGYISRDGKSMAGTIIDLNKIQQAAKSETKLALNVGAGLKWLPSKRFGARLQARYTPTYLHDASSDFCDPFGFCQDWLHQFELTAGVVVRF